MKHKRRQPWNPPARHLQERSGIGMMPLLFSWKFSNSGFVAREADNGLLLVDQMPVIRIGTGSNGSFFFEVRNWNTFTDPTRVLSQFTRYDNALWLQLAPATPDRPEAYKFWKKHERLWQKHHGMAQALETGEIRGSVANDAVWSMLWDFCVAKGAPLFKEFRDAYPGPAAYYDDFVKKSKEP